MITICELCIIAFEPKVLNGVRLLIKFEDYTVDLRLQQFRKVTFESNESSGFIDFDSPKGQ